MSIPEETVIEEREQCALVSNDFDWQYMVHNTVDRVSLDISHCGITNVPSSFLAKCYNMQYLYLESNKLTELGEAFFPSLKHLKWLDVRNNILKTVPHSIADHNALQVLLLEGNMIEALPPFNPPPGYERIFGNERADVLANLGSAFNMMGPQPLCGILRCESFGAISNGFTLNMREGNIFTESVSFGRINSVECVMRRRKLLNTCSLTVLK
ncbi:hypothetical protein J6590_098874 [Homalodisca vitripennis]|nr:hypothetical protein J6590_098874 [Homalodisca vitripennis]